MSSEITYFCDRPGCNNTPDRDGNRITRGRLDEPDMALCRNSFSCIPHEVDLCEECENELNEWWRSKK